MKISFTALVVGIQVQRVVGIQVQRVEETSQYRYISRFVTALGAHSPEPPKDPQQVLSSCLR
jgi:hypothetical protein